MYITSDQSGCYYLHLMRSSVIVSSFIKQDNTKSPLCSACFTIHNKETDLLSL